MPYGTYEDPSTLRIFASIGDFRDAECDA